MEERRGALLLGDPGYYERFGFRCDADLTLPGFPPEYFQVRVLGEGPCPKGEVTYAPAFRETPRT